MTLLRDLFWGERAYLTYWYALLLSFPFTWRTVLIPSVRGGDFNEYLDISVYVSDILMLCTFILLIKHEYSIKSIYSKLAKLFHVEHAMIAPLGIYGIFLFFRSANGLLYFEALWSISRILIVAFITCLIFRKFHLENCSTWNNVNTKNKCSTWNIMRFSIWILAVSAILQSIIAILQFYFNESIGVRFLGESILSSILPGVAKIDVFFDKHIRSYGTFLHPNILAAYLGLLLLLFMQYRRFIMFHVEQGIAKMNKLFHVEQSLIVISIILSITALLVTFSKTVIVSLAVVIFIQLFHVEQFGNHLKRMFHVEQFLLPVLICMIIFTTLIYGSGQIEKSIHERVDIIKDTRLGISQLLFGTGPGQSVYHNFDLYNEEPWKRQPIHSLYLLLVYEWGIVGIGILIVFGLRMWYKYVPRGTYSINWAMLGFVGLIAISDHYLIDIQAGNMLLGLALGLIINTKLTKSQFTVV